MLAGAWDHEPSTHTWSPRRPVHVLLQPVNVLLQPVHVPQGHGSMLPSSLRQHHSDGLHGPQHVIAQWPVQCGNICAACCSGMCHATHPSGVVPARIQARLQCGCHNAVPSQPCAVLCCCCRPLQLQPVKRLQGVWPAAGCCQLHHCPTWAHTQGGGQVCTARRCVESRNGHYHFRCGDYARV